jgi:sigma-B regulation protein RsbQ
VEDVLELCRIFDLRDLVFVGHSVGAMVGLRAALRAPERFAALIMLGASSRYLDDEGYTGGFTERDVEELLAGFDTNREAWTDQMARTATAQPHRPDMVEEVKAKFLSAEPSLLRQFARATFSVDCRGDLGTCRTPVLLLQSREDPIVPVAVSEFLRSSIPGATLRYLGTSGHFAQLSAPEEVVEAMRAFLASLEASRG